MVVDTIYKIKSTVVIWLCLLPMLLIGFVSCTKKVETNKKDSKHPSLILTKQGVRNIRENLGNIPIFDRTLEVVKLEIDAEIEKGFDVPIPKDLSGGYTHETHKKNFFNLQKAGVLYQILQDNKYANYVKNMLLVYAKVYPTLPIHPQTRSYARGKLFWQCLNDSNWLVYASQAYDCIFDYLTPEEHKILETDLFRPFANFISKENPQFFNRVHNHSTWGNVAVGMIALVLEDDSLLQRALYGLKTDGLNSSMKDNDGGFIKTEGQKVGFLANLDEPFSPDGYYTEGPYYQRYAMYPFLIFAQALQNKKPEFNIFEYKDGVLIKAVDALINLSNVNGDFFTLNDAQKGMSYYSSAVVSSVDIAYHYGGNNPELLSIAKKQNMVTLDDAGLNVALGIKNGKAQPYKKSSIELSDGPEGNKGAVGVLRNDNVELVFKYTAHGLSHGHFDKLSYSLFNDGNEVVQDYGLVRFVNIEQKGGGNYLKENKTWAKQTISHNTLVQDETSHFNGNYAKASKHNSEKYIFDITNPSLQVASAKEVNAYPDTKLQRTIVTIANQKPAKPYILDILRVSSNTSHQYDLPFYYLGHIMQTSFSYKTANIFKPLGTSNGYQHLFEEARAVVNDKNIKLTWMVNKKFYTYTATASKGDHIILARIGANDPDFNLRRDPTLILRKPDSKNAIFVSIIEPHGTYSPVSELAINAYSTIDSIHTIHNSDRYTVIKINKKNKDTFLFMLSNKDSSAKTLHEITLNKQVYKWEGPFKFIKNDK